MKTTLRLTIAAFGLAMFNLATTVVQGQFNYVTNNGTITITGYTGPDGAVTIPDTFNGLPVTSIGSVAFAWCNSLTSVTIPNSVTMIGGGAFSECTSLTEITVDTSNAAYSSLDGVLFDKSQTTLIRCPAGKVGSYTIPDSVTMIGGSAFSGCTSLTSVTIPDSVTSIGWMAFSGCTSLTEITVDSSNAAYSSLDGVLFDKSQTTLIQCPEGKVGSYTIPNSITSIGDLAFWGCTSLTSVTIPNSVTSIRHGAFWYCRSLTGVYFQGTEPTHGDAVLSGAPATVYYLSGVLGWRSTFGGRPTALWDPQEQWAFTINDGAITITAYLGSDAEVIVPDTVDGLPVRTISNRAFAGRSLLTTLDLRGNGLTSFTLSGGLTSLMRLDLSSNQLARFAVPYGLTSLRELCLNHNPLTSLGVPAESGGLTVLDLRETSLITLVLPEQAVAALNPPIETLRSQGTVVHVYRPGAITHYVSLESTNPIPPYVTWDTAANVLQDAVDAAKAGDTVLVTNGVYALGSREVSILVTNLNGPWTRSFGVSRVVVTNAVRLESVNGPEVTAIHGEHHTNEWGLSGGGVRCVYLGDNAVLSGFTITKGGGTYLDFQKGGGVYCESGTSVLTNCVLANNSVVGAEPGGFGGGVRGGTLFNCTLTGNRAYMNGVGGGACGSTLFDCTLTGNWGGGAYQCTLFDCTLTGNWGGGAHGCTLYNCNLFGNAGGGGASGSWLYNCTLSGNSSGSDGTFLNCTVINNQGGISGTAFNSIIYYNSGGNCAEGTTLNYCCTTPLPTNGVGNITGPPLFMDMAAADFRPREDSPCNDAGTNLLGMTWTYQWFDQDTWEDRMVVDTITDPTDILGNSRFIDGNGDSTVAWDIGAFEFNSFRPPRFSIAPQRTSDGWTLNITGAPNKWVHLQRSGNLKDWEEIWSGFMWEPSQQVNDADTGPGVMFYRVVVQ